MGKRTQDGGHARRGRRLTLDGDPTTGYILSPIESGVVHDNIEKLQQALHSMTHATPIQREALLEQAQVYADALEANLYALFPIE